MNQIFFWSPNSSDVVYHTRDVITGNAGIIKFKGCFKELYICARSLSKVETVIARKYIVYNSYNSIERENELSSE